MRTRSERTIISHEGPPTKVIQPSLVYPVAGPPNKTDGIPLEEAAQLMQISIEDMRRLATEEGLWYSPNATGQVFTHVLRGIRGHFIDTKEFNLFRQSLLKAERTERKAEDFRSRMLRDLD